jgi:hypothetical protein
MIFMPVIHRSHLLQHPQILLQVVEYNHKQELTLTSVLNVRMYPAALNARSAEI